MAENINPSQYYTPETLRRLGNLAKGIYNYTGRPEDDPRNYNTNFNDLQNATNNVRQWQALAPYNDAMNQPFYYLRLPTKSSPATRHHQVENVYPEYLKNFVYFDGSYVPDLAQFFDITKEPAHDYWSGKTVPRTNQARNPQY